MAGKKSRLWLRALAIFLLQRFLFWRKWRKSPENCQTRNNSSLAAKSPNQARFMTAPAKSCFMKFTARKKELLFLLKKFPITSKKPQLPLKIKIFTFIRLLIGGR